MLQAHIHSTPRKVRRSGFLRFVPPALRGFHGGRGAPRAGGDSVRGAAKVSAVRNAFAISVLLVGVLCSSVRADEAQPSVNTLSDARDADRRIVDVVESLGVDLIQGPSSDVSSGAQALVSTRESPMPMLLWVDSGHSSITLVRAADGYLLSRNVARDIFSDAPYAAAVIATEMVELMREALPKRGVSGRPDAEDLRAHVALHDDASSCSARGRSTDSRRSVGALAARGRWTRLSRRRVMA